MKRSHICIAILLFGAAAHAAQPVNAPKSFPTPKAAAQALLAAAEANNTPALVGIFGLAGKDIVVSGDPVQDKNRRSAFVERAKKQMKVEGGKGPSKRAILLLGDDAFPFPVPIVKGAAGWHFDPHSGKRELLARRIGANEIDAIDLCTAYVEEQHQFASEDPERSGVHQYAQRFISSPGKRDGLYWPETAGAPISPVASLVTEASEEGYDVSGDKHVPYRGYNFRILTAQGPHAKGGARNYVAHNLMLGGFALVAWPAEYGASGIKTFLVNQDGVVYEKDLGKRTADLAGEIRTFNPDVSWKAVK